MLQMWDIQEHHQIKYFYLLCCTLQSCTIKGLGRLQIASCRLGATSVCFPEVKLKLKLHGCFFFFAVHSVSSGSDSNLSSKPYTLIFILCAAYNKKHWPIRSVNIIKNNEALQSLLMWLINGIFEHFGPSSLSLVSPFCCNIRLLIIRYHNIA